MRVDADLANLRLGEHLDGSRMHTVHLGRYPAAVTVVVSTGQMLKIAQAWNDLAGEAQQREHGGRLVHGPRMSIERLVELL